MLLIKLQESIVSKYNHSCEKLALVRSEVDRKMQQSEVKDNVLYDNNKKLDEIDEQLVKTLSILNNTLIVSHIHC